MESKLIYKGKESQLTEDFTDIGYMAENIEVNDLEDTLLEIKRSHSNGAMTLLVSFPFIEDFEEEILKIDHFMSAIQVDIYCYFIFPNQVNNLRKLQQKLSKFIIVQDSEDEFGNMYGTLFVNGELEDKLTKSLFLISKDGAIFYMDMPKNLEEELKLDRLQVELNKAYVTYTGVGCHA